MPMVDALALITVRAYRCTNSRKKKKEEDLRRNIPRPEAILSAD